MKYIPVRYFSLVFVVLLLVTSCKNGINEKEPNDTFEDAVMLTLENEVRGYIADEKDRDVYYLDIDSKTSVSISLSSLKGINHSLTLYRELQGKQAVLKKIDDSRKSSPEYFPAFGLIPGRYYIEVSHGERDKRKGSLETAYRLLISSVAYETVEFEPNDAKMLATPISSGSPMYAFFSPSFDKLRKSSDDRYQEYDYFSFDVSPAYAGNYLADITVSGVPGVDSVVVVYAPDGKILNRTDASPIGVAESIVGQGLVTAGEYFIKVYAKNYASNNEEPYTITLAVSKFDSSLEMERNNEISSANILRNGTVKGRIFPEGDIDYFNYTPDNQNQYIDIKLVPSQSINARLTVYDSEEKQLFEVDTMDTGLPEILPGIFAGNGVFLKVEAFAGEVDADRFYSLSVATNDYGQFLELEPNDTKERATFVENDYIYGYSTKPGDKDYYLVETSEKGSVSFKVTGAAEASFELSITDNLGYIIESYELEGENVLEIEELVNKRCYLIMEAKKENYSAAYIIELLK